MLTCEWILILYKVEIWYFTSKKHVQTIELLSIGILRNGQTFREHNVKKIKQSPLKALEQSFTIKKIEYLNVIFSQLALFAIWRHAHIK